MDERELIWGIDYHLAHSTRSVDGCHCIEELVSRTRGPWATYNQPAFFEFNGKKYIAFPYNLIQLMK